MLYPELSKTIENLNVSSISEDRQKILLPLIHYIREKNDLGQAVLLNFICTHNSRRSHLSQLWAQAMASYFEIPLVYCYSGGTESTAMYPMIAQVLKESGMMILPLSEGINPVYAVKFGPNLPPTTAFSKSFDHPLNPISGFAAVMTCSQANEACPFNPGADMRIPIEYEDPKISDGTDRQHLTYSERSIQIATELKFVFSQITLPQ